MSDKTIQHDGCYEHKPKEELDVFLRFEAFQSGLRSFRQQLNNMTLYAHHLKKSSSSAKNQRGHDCPSVLKVKLLTTSCSLPNDDTVYECVCVSGWPWQPQSVCVCVCVCVRVIPQRHQSRGNTSSLPSYLHTHLSFTHSQLFLLHTLQIYLSLSVSLTPFRAVVVCFFYNNHPITFYLCHHFLSVTWWEIN